jgi:hypothetical protein
MTSAQLDIVYPQPQPIAMLESIFHLFPYPFIGSHPISPARYSRASLGEQIYLNQTFDQRNDPIRTQQRCVTL